MTTSIVNPSIQEFVPILVPGDVLVSSWGYDQTNVDFFEVLCVNSARTVTVCQIKSRIIGDRQCVPCVGQYIGEPMRKRLTRRNSIKIQHLYAHQWDGMPCYFTTNGH